MRSPRFAVISLGGGVQSLRMGGGAMAFERNGLTRERRSRILELSGWGKPVRC